MNIEYIKLTDGNTLVTDENGKITKLDNNTSIDELLFENINESINISKEKVEDNKNMLRFSKYWLFLGMPIIVAVIAICGYFSGGLNGIFTELTATNFLTIPMLAFWIVTAVVSKEKLNKWENNLEQAKQIKIDFENKLAKEKELSLQKEIPVNEPISIIQPNEYTFSTTDKQLETEYSENMETVTKRLVLERKPYNRR